MSGGPLTPPWMTRPLALLALALVLASPEAAAQPCTTSWISAASGDWNDAANWTAGVPDTTDNACVVVPGTYTVSNTSGAAIAVRSFTFGGAVGTQTLDTSLGIAISQPSTVGDSARVEWSDGAFTGARLDVDGTLVLDGLNFGGRRVEGASALLVTHGPVEWQREEVALYDGGTWEHRGTMTAPLTGNASLDNGGTTDGLFRVASGAIDVAGPFTLSLNTPTIYLGAYLTSSDSSGALELRTRPHVIAGVISGDPAGLVRIDTEIRAQGPNARLNFSGEGVSWESGFLTSGTLLNYGLLVLDGFNFNSRGIDASGGAAQLRNIGTIRWERDEFVLRNGGVLLNDAFIEAPLAASTELNQSGGTSGLLTNSGTIRVTTPYTLSLKTPATHTDATLDATVADAALVLRDEPHTVSGTVSGSPVGLVRIATDTRSATASTELDFGGKGISWESGFLTSGTLTNAGLLVLDGLNFNSRGVQAPAALVNASGATIRWEQDEFTLDGGRLSNLSGATIDAALVSSTVLRDGATEGLFDNNMGTLQVSGPNTLTIESPSLHTDATLDATVADAALVLRDGPHEFSGTTSGDPVGLVRLAGDFSATVSSGSTFDFGGEGLSWESGFLTDGIATNTGLIVLDGINFNTRGLNTGSLTNEGVVEWVQDEFVIADGARWDNGGFGPGLSGELRATGGNRVRLIGLDGDVGEFALNGGSGRLFIEGPGTLEVDVNFRQLAASVIGGTGTLDLLGAPSTTQAGFTAPGLSPGTLTWTGKPWTPFPAASGLRVEIGGSTAGTDYDLLSISGTAELDGTLEIEIADGQAPAVGESFTVLTASGVTGTFSAVATPPGYAVSVAYNSTDVTVTVDAVGVETVLEGSEGWRMLAPAFAGQTYDDVLGPILTTGFPGSDLPNRGANTFLYDESVTTDTDGDGFADQADGYVLPSAQGDPFPLGTGAFVYVYAEQDGVGSPEGFPQTIVQSGVGQTAAFAFDPSFTSSGNADADGWTLMGNPFAYSMDWADAAWTRTGMSNSVYVWDLATAQYRTHNTLLGDLPDGLVAPGQGFWVQATAPSPALEAPASARTTGATFYARPPAVEHVELRMRAASGEGPGEASAYVAFVPGAEAGADPYDAFELAPAAGDALALWTGRLTDGVGLDIQALPPEAASGASVDVGVQAWEDWAPAAAEVVLMWPTLPGDVPLSLLDRETGATVDLRETTSYAFTIGAAGRPLASPGEASRPARPAAAPRPRFMLSMGTPVSGGDEAAPVTALYAPRPNPASSRAVVPYALAEAGAVRVAVYDLLGREVAVLADGPAARGAHEAPLDTRTLAPGVYVMRMTASGGFTEARRLTVVR